MYLVFRGGNGFLFNVNWVEFNTSVTSSKDIGGFADATSQVVIYPNPVESLTTIQNAADSTITIYAMDSRVLFTQTISSDNETIDLSELDTGIYFAEIKKLTSTNVIKLVKN